MDKLEGMENPHFDVSAAVIRQLGAELISDEVTAIMELIKNSYDADADWVRISISTSKASNPDHYYQDVLGKIVIEDNGFGMDEGDIRDGWLVISVSKKRADKEKGKTTPSGRTPLGDKGVGRLSVQRLGNKVEMITGKKRKDYFTRVAFDWNDFRDDIPLANVKIFTNRIKKDNNREGTTLVISDLIDPKKWTGQSWTSFWSHLSQLIFPYKDKRVFEVYLNKDGEAIDLDTLNENLRSLAVSEHVFSFSGKELSIKSKVSIEKLSGSTKDQEFIEQHIKVDSGKDFFNFLTDSVSNKKFFISNARHLGEGGQLFEATSKFQVEAIDKLIYLDDSGSQIDESDHETDRSLAQPGSFYGEIRDYYFKETETLENTFDSLGEFKKVVQNQAGIRIFRDGFGLRPYGLDGNDWLNLGGSQTSGASYYGLRPGNVIGFISISAKNNRYLKEKTDREGFVASPHSLNFMRLSNKVRDEINDILRQTRRSFNEYKNRKIKDQTGFLSITDSLAKLQSTSSKAKSLERKTEKTVQEIKAFETVLKSETQRIESSKKDKAEYSQSKRFIEQVAKLLGDVHPLLEQLKVLVGDARKLESHVQYLEPSIKDLEDQLNDFSQLAGLGLTAEALSHELSNIIDRISQQIDKAVLEYNKKPQNASQILLLFVENVRSAIKSFRKQLSHLAPSLKYVRENKEKLSLVSFCSESVNFYQEKFNGKIQVRLEPNGTDFSIEANKGRLTQVFDNIVLNSEYWLKERMKSETGFLGVLAFEVREPFVYIHDNGFGIDPLIEDRIFQPFVTSKPKDIGRGLGLFIVQQLMESIGCSVILSSRRNEMNRRYIFQIDFSRILKK